MADKSATCFLLLNHERTVTWTRGKGNFCAATTFHCFVFTNSKMRSFSKRDVYCLVDAASSNRHQVNWRAGAYGMEILTVYLFLFTQLQCFSGFLYVISEQPI